jgi:hypothetical protein
MRKPIPRCSHKKTDPILGRGKKGQKRAHSDVTDPVPHLVQRLSLSRLNTVSSSVQIPQQCVCVCVVCLQGNVVEKRISGFARHPELLLHEQITDHRLAKQESNKSR